MKKENIDILKKGGVGIVKTDTLYGILGSALSKKTVKRIHKIKSRNKNKPFIILISSIKDLEKFGVQVDDPTKKILNKYWPGKVSIILPLSPRPQTLNPFYYLHRGKKSLAFRLPAKKSLTEAIKKTGPLVAPSANPEGKTPAKSIREAKKYFGDLVDFYESGRNSSSRASQLIEIKNGKEKILRK